MFSLSLDAASGCGLRCASLALSVLDLFSAFAATSGRLKVVPH